MRRGVWLPSILTRRTTSAEPSRGERADPPVHYVLPSTDPEETPMSDTVTRPASGVQRLVALLVLLVCGILSLPLAASAFDGDGSENWILPTQLVGMALVGAVVGLLLPGVAGQAESSRRSMLVGAGLGLLMAVIGVVIFFLLLSGFDGA